MIQIGDVYATFCQEEGILLRKYSDGKGRCIVMLVKSIGVRGRFGSPELRSYLEPILGVATHRLSYIIGR